MSINKIRINNDKIWEITQNGEDLDQWLNENIGIGYYTEWISPVAIRNPPYRTFSFENPNHETLFLLKWG